MKNYAMDWGWRERGSKSDGNVRTMHDERMGSKRQQQRHGIDARALRPF